MDGDIKMDITGMDENSRSTQDFLNELIPKKEDPKQFINPMSDTKKLGHQTFGFEDMSGNGLSFGTAQDAEGGSEFALQSFNDSRYDTEKFLENLLSPAVKNDSSGHDIKSEDVDRYFSDHQSTTDMMDDLKMDNTGNMLFGQRDDFIGSFDSSVGSEFLSSSLSSSLSYQMPGSTLSNSLNNGNFMNSVRSPSSSLRTGTYISPSVRPTNISVSNSHQSTNNNNVMTPNSVSSPSMPRTSSLSAYDNQQYAMGSVPKTVGGINTGDKLRRKREFHNAVERRRRELIREKIKELGKLIPPSMLPYDSSGKKAKTNKGTILNKTVEHLYYLKNILIVQAQQKEQLKNLITQLESLEFNKANDSSAVTDHYEPTEGRILDTRTMPSQPGADTFMNKDLTRDISLSNFLESAMQEDDAFHQNSQLNALHPSSDLDKFLSGAVIEAEDNVQLLSNLAHNGSGTSNFPSKYTL